MGKIKIAIPHMDNYEIPAKFLIKKALKLDVVDTPKISKKTVELGVKYSPEFICTPFKYTLGSLIEGLELGANVLLQNGGGCRYGYYADLQEAILKKQGYKFKMINLISAGKLNIFKIYKEISKLTKFNIFTVLYYFIVTKIMINLMDKFDDYYRKNYVNSDKEKYKSIKKQYYRQLSKVNNLKELLSLNYYSFKSLKVNKKSKRADNIKIALIGELYTLMEPYANFNIEDKLLDYNIELHRFTNVSYLLFEKKRKIKHMLKRSSYIKYKMGADASDNICRTENLCKLGFDGIIHIKSSFCTPEIGAMNIIDKICKKYDVPVIFLSYDMATSEVGVETRLEAFMDIIEMRHKND